MSYRTHPLYRLAREISTQPIDWSNPALAHLQHEMRIDYVEKMPTLDLITTVCRDEGDAMEFSLTLAQIHSQREQPSAMSLDDALGQGRR